MSGLDYHSNRRSIILQTYPEIKNLMRPEWKSKWIALFFLLIPQIYISLNIYKLSLLNYILVTYFIGATINQALFLAIHECSHNLFFKSTNLNKIFSIFLNLPIVFPFSIAFRQYHLEHHKNLGIYGKDTDLPSHLEIKLVNNKKFPLLSKFLWMNLQIIWYALRPIFIKKLIFNEFLIYNSLVQFLYNFAVLNSHSCSPIIYGILCNIISGGLHPCAYHFISEHYLLSKEHKQQETYSYYGILNYLTWNVGYHNEHHDFPNIPWSNLKKVRSIAKFSYNRLYNYKSWYLIFKSFLFDDNISLNNRKINCD